MLHPLAAHVLAVAYFGGGDLVDFVENDDAAFCARDVVVGCCEEAVDTHFGVFADVACLGEGRAVGHGEGDVEDSGEGFGHQCFADARGAQHEDV